MKKKAFVTGYLVGVMLLANFLFPASAHPSEKVVNLRWAGAGEGSSLYLCSLSVADIINKHSKKVRISVEVSPGSIIIPRMIEAGQVLIGAGSSVGNYSATKGLPPYKKPVTKVRRLCVYSQFLFSAFALKEKEIYSLADLNGKVVGIGPEGTPAAKNAQLLIKELGIKCTVRFNPTATELVERIKDGLYDAGMYSTGHPWAGLLDLTTYKDVRVFGLNKEEQDKFLKAYPTNLPGAIPANTYRGQTEDVTSFGSFAGFNASADLPEDIAYEVLMTLEKHYKEWLVAVPNATKFLDWDAQKTFVAPLHPGTIRWLKGHGVSVP